MDLIKWRKARQSDGQGGAYVEVARFSGAVAVRDSRAPDAGHITLTPDTFRALLTGLRR